MAVIVNCGVGVGVGVGEEFESSLPQPVNAIETAAASKLIFFITLTSFVGEP